MPPGHCRSAAEFGKQLRGVMLFDVTRLAARLLEGKRPTGVDRVSLAYIERFRDGAQALVRHWGRWVSPGERGSQRIFAALLGEMAQPAQTIRSAVAVGHVLGSPIARGALLFNTGHSGLDAPGYAQAVVRFGLRPVYFLHDLIPITHPEYCREGEASRHEQRLHTMLSTGSGLIANSEATGAALWQYGKAAGLHVPPLIVAPLGTPGFAASAVRLPSSAALFRDARHDRATQKSFDDAADVAANDRGRLAGHSDSGHYRAARMGMRTGLGLARAMPWIEGQGDRTRRL